MTDLRIFNYLLRVVPCASVRCPWRLFGISGAVSAANENYKAIPGYTNWCIDKKLVIFSGVSLRASTSGHGAPIPLCPSGKDPPVDMREAGQAITLAPTGFNKNAFTIYRGSSVVGYSYSWGGQRLKITLILPVRYRYSNYIFSYLKRTLQTNVTVMNCLWYRISVGWES